MITLNQSLELMKRINQSKDYECFFSAGKLTIQEKVIRLTERGLLEK